MKRKIIEVFIFLCKFAFCIGLLVIDYVIAVFIAKIFNVYNVEILQYSVVYAGLTWEVMIFFILGAIEFGIIDYFRENIL